MLACSVRHFISVYTIKYALFVTSKAYRHEYDHYVHKTSLECQSLAGLAQLCVNSVGCCVGSVSVGRHVFVSELNMEQILVPQGSQVSVSTPHV